MVAADIGVVAALLGASAALLGIKQLIANLWRSLILPRLHSSLKINVKASDGTVTVLNASPSTGKAVLNEEQLKRILKVLSEAEHGGTETKNSKE